jgi:hypothetical protein
VDDDGDCCCAESEVSAMVKKKMAVQGEVWGVERNLTCQ